MIYAAKERNSINCVNFESSYLNLKQNDSDVKVHTKYVGKSAKCILT